LTSSISTRLSGGMQPSSAACRRPDDAVACRPGTAEMETINRRNHTPVPATNNVDAPAISVARSDSEKNIQSVTLTPMSTMREQKRHYHIRITPVHYSALLLLSFRDEHRRRWGTLLPSSHLYLRRWPVARSLARICCRVCLAHPLIPFSAAGVARALSATGL